MHRGIWKGFIWSNTFFKNQETIKVVRVSRYLFSRGHISSYSVMRARIIIRYFLWDPIKAPRVDFNNLLNKCRSMPSGTHCPHVPLLCWRSQCWPYLLILYRILSQSAKGKVSVYKQSRVAAGQGLESPGVCRIKQGGNCSQNPADYLMCCRNTHTTLNIPAPCPLRKCIPQSAVTISSGTYREVGRKSTKDSKVRCRSKVIAKLQSQKVPSNKYQWLIRNKWIEIGKIYRTNISVN